MKNRIGSCNGGRGYRSCVGYSLYGTDGIIWVIYTDTYKRSTNKERGRKMRNMMRCAIGVLCVVWVCGCATDYVQGTKVSDDKMASFTKGKTTKDEVVAALGGPQDIKLEGGKQILMYKYQKVSSFSGNEGWDTTFIFNDKGVLEDIMKSRGSSLPNPLTGR